MTSHDTPDEESLTADTQVQCTGGRPPRPNQETTVSNTASAPLYPPLYGASFGQAIARFFKKYATFSGRASRSEYWWWFLFNFIVGIVLYVIALILGFVQVDAATNTVTFGPGYWFVSIVGGLWGLAILVPHLAVIWRRLHDTNKSGGFFFLAFIPFVGGIILIVLLALDTNPAGARFDQAA
ncbi:MAG: DUF805 domain-containing protein [Microbacterium sp.]|nr:DUF805 domain-containing protein [Microbacterium sp.]MBN9196177.1 DUF805 domain-containing protein [Microbacterium sp.]